MAEFSRVHHLQVAFHVQVALKESMKQQEAEKIEGGIQVLNLDYVPPSVGAPPFTLEA